MFTLLKAFACAAVGYFVLLTVLGTAVGPQPSALTASSSQISLAKFRQLRDGMSYYGATELLGREGNALSRTVMDIPGGEVKSVMYGWQNADGSNMNAMFLNDRMISRAQWGLR